MAVETTSKDSVTAEDDFDQAEEMMKQTDLLKSINGKLGFFVFIVIMAIIFQFLGLLLRF